MDAFRAWCARNRLALAVVAAGWLVRLALILLGGQLNALKWRTYEPDAVFTNVENLVTRRLGA